MKNIPRPGKYVIHENTDETKKFDFKTRLHRYRKNRSIWGLLILFSALMYLVFFLWDFPLK